MANSSDSQSQDQPLPPNPYLERLFEITPDMLCVAGLDGYFKIINPAFERNLGYCLEELKEKPFLDFVQKIRNYQFMPWKALVARKILR